MPPVTGDIQWTWTGTTATTMTLSRIQPLIWNQWVTSSTGWVTTGDTTYNIQGATWERWLDYDGVVHREIATQEEILRMRQERADRLQAQREADSRRFLAEQARLEGAQDRGMELLLSLLTNEERVWHDLHDELMVRGSEGGLYLIAKHGVHGNITEVDEHGCRLANLCVAPGMMDRDAGLALPLADGWIGQYLAIKNQEAVLRQAANWSMQRVCQQPGIPILGAA